MPQLTVLADPTTPTQQAQVDGSLANAGHFALRTSLRPMDFGQPFSNYGSYSYSGITGTTAAGSGAIFVCAFRNTDANRLMLIRRVRAQQGWVATTFAAGVCAFEMFVARAYSVADSTGGTLQTLTPGAKRRGTMGPSQAQLYLATTGALSAGTRTTDASPCATLVGAVQATAGATMIEARDNLWDCREAGKWPIVLAQNEGFLIRSTAPATGTYATAVEIDWDEVQTF